MRSISLLWIMLLCFGLSAQKEVNVWEFGYGAGLDFNYDPPRVLTDGKLWTSEGCASICDENGKLLMYTDGLVVYNGKHDTMVNGTELHGTFSSSQSAMIVQLPENDSIYLIFNPGEISGLSEGFYYSVVNVRARGGRGEVINKNIKLRDLHRTEAVSSARHANGRDIWVVFKGDKTDFYSYLVTPLGVSSQVILSQPGPYTGYLYPDGYVKCSKFSPSGTKFALTTHIDGACLYDFDKNTGKLSNLIVIPFSQPYGIEFSPDGKKLYVSSWTGAIGLAQYDISSGNLSKIEASLHEISKLKYIGAIQIGPDKRMYVVRHTSKYISVILYPNLDKAACEYKEDHIFLNGKTTGVGLPPFMSTYFSDSFSAMIKFTGKCAGDSFYFSCTNLKNDDSLAWNFGEGSSGSSNISSLHKPAHAYSKAGSFSVTAAVYGKNINKVYAIKKNIKTSVKVLDYLGRANEYAPAHKKCIHDSVDVKPLNNGPSISKVFWNDISGNHMSRNIRKPGLYVVTVYRAGSSCFYMDSIKVSDMPYVPKPSLGKDTQYCVPYGLGFSGTLGLQLPAGYIFKWNTGESSRIIKIEKAGEYVVTMARLNECANSDTVNISKAEYPFYTALQDTLMCNDNILKKIGLAAGNYQNIHWSTGENGVAMTVGPPGKYWYTVNNQCGTLKDSFMLSLINAPVVDLGKDLTACSANGFPLKSNVTGTSYRWLPGEETGESVFLYEAGNITLEVKNEAGCIGRDDIFVIDSCREECFLPDAFSPNGDLLNDVFRPYGNDIRTKGYVFRIYDRWGGQIFETLKPGEGWDGTFNNTMCMSGVYFYTVEYVNMRKQMIYLRGTFTLIQ